MNDFVKLARGHAILLIGTIAAVATLFWRIRFGVDFSDEAFYLATGFRFWLGDRPFIDEINLAQSMGFLLAPLIGVYRAVSGQLDGIFLWVRFLYVLFVCAVAATAFVCLRRDFSLRVAGCAAVLYLGYVPMNLPTLSYYTMGAGFFSAALLVGAYQKRYAVSGGLFALAGIAYPPMAVVFPFQALTLGITKQRKQALGLALAAAATFGLFALFFKITPAAFLDYLTHLKNQKSPHTTDLASLHHVLEFILDHVKYLVLRGAPILLVAHFIDLRFKLVRPVRLALLTLPLPILFYLNRVTIGGLGTLGVIVCVAALAPLYLLDRERPLGEKLATVWLPSILIGTVIGILSTNGAIALGIAWMPAFLLSVALWFSRIERCEPRAAELAFVFLAFCFLLNLRSAYNEDNVSHLTAKVTEGPYRGLYTAPVKLTFLNQLQGDIAKLPPDFDSLFLSPHFPAAYLLIPLKPTGVSLWDMCFWRDPQVCFDDSRKSFTPHTLVLLMKTVPYKPELYSETPGELGGLPYYPRLKQPPLVDRREYAFFRENR